jgi:hypothetical protein
MKVDYELISAALDAVLERNKVAPYGAIPLKSLAQHWENIRLRSTDLASGIEELYKQGRIDLEARRDGLWLRRKGKETPASGGPYSKLRASVRAIVVGIALERVNKRRPDGYSGFDRRGAVRGP